MSLTCLILFLLVSSLWYFIYEYPTLFGIFVPTCAFRRIYFKLIVSFFFLSAVMYGCMCDFCLPLSQSLRTLDVDPQSIIIILLSALIMLMLLKMFSIRASGVYSLIGAFQAYLMICGVESDYRMGISFIAAPVLGFFLSALLRFIFRVTLERSHIHLVTLSYYMRYVVIIGLAFTAFAAGLNWGGFIMAGAGIIFSGGTYLWIIVPILAVLVFFLSPLMRSESDVNAGRYADSSVYTVLSIGLSVAVTLVIFSFESSAGLLLLSPAPLSVGSLVFSAAAGSEAVRKYGIVSRDDFAKEILALLLAPLGSLLIAYLLFRISGINDEAMLDFTVMAASVLVLVAMLFHAYARRQKIQRESVDRLVYSQQQQIYENSRALNDMELKVILSENQALHNAVEMKRQEVMNVALSIVEQKEYLESLNMLVKKLSMTADEGERDGLIAELSASLKQRLSYDRDVDSQYFYAQAESLHEDFNAKLSENFPDLTQQEKRLATLLRLGFSSKYIATLMNITPKSVEISRYRLRQKLGLTRGDNLVNFIKSI